MANLTGLAINPDVKESGSGFEVIPAGKYQAAIVSDELKDTKAANGKILELNFDIVKGDFKGCELINRLNIINQSEKAQMIGQGILKRICFLCNVPFPPPDSRRLWGKIMTIKVKVKDYEKDGEKRQSNEITGYSKAEEETSAVTAVAPATNNW